MILITPEILFKVFPKCNKDLVKALLPFLNQYLPAFGIDAKIEVCHFFAQAGHETDSFKVLIEYASGKDYEHNMDLGNAFAGDGVKFKGHGIFMTTGRKNHLIAGEQIFQLPVFGEERKVFANDAVLENPFLLAEPKWAVASACIYWKQKKLSELCVADNQMVSIRRLIRGTWVDYPCYPIEAITRRINGGMNGFDERKKNYVALQKAIG